MSARRIDAAVIAEHDALRAFAGDHVTVEYRQLLVRDDEAMCRRVEELEAALREIADGGCARKFTADDGYPSISLGNCKKIARAALEGGSGG